MSPIWLLALLLTKHFIVDFPMQGPYQYKNKGTFGHLGGLLHALSHGMATWAIVPWFIHGYFAFSLGFAFGLFDFFVHYLVDWSKMNLNKRMGWTPINSEFFWWLLGLDQWLHHMTYIAITLLVFA